MHADDARVAEVGDMFVNRKRSNAILRALLPRLIGFGQAERFTPDILIEDGSTLSAFGLEARAIVLPGHSPGSIGILTADGHFFCGDLFDNTKQPALNSLVDDRDAAVRSAKRLSALGIGTVYPGHGQPFSMDQLAEG
jgi:glyoxylase-like metal-dependent hydrolase (beta-lactamase superfamily II)